MKIKAFTLVEIGIVFSLILIVSALVIPIVVDDSKKVQEISMWRHTYDDVSYAFQSMFVDNSIEYQTALSEKIKNAKDSEEIEDIVLKEFKPYLRVESKFEDKKYRPKYLNSERVKEGQYYYFNRFYTTQNDTIVGIKWLGELYDKSSVLALMFDLNGKAAPNTWGKDIFGVNVYKDRLEPFGKDIPPYEVSNDCSKKGRGVYCSYSYLTNAQF